MNQLIRGARAVGEPTFFDREITLRHAAGGTRRWGIFAIDEEGDEVIIWNTGENWDRVTESTPGAQPVTVYEE